MTILCISPVTIDNPNYGKRFVAGDINSLKDCTSAKLRVPCGHCPECIANKQMQLVQRVQMESLSNYLFFATLTYNNDSLPVLTTSTGYDIRYADISDLQKCFKRLRKSNAFGRPFRYFAVSELGSKRGRPHFHVLFFVPKYDSDDKFVPQNLESVLFKELLHEWRRNYGSTRSPVYKPLCTYQVIFRHGKRISNYDCHYVVPLLGDDTEASVAFYVLKYMLKRSDRETRLQRALHLNLSEAEYDSVWSLVRSRFIVSKGFGINGFKSPFGDLVADPRIVSWLRKCIDFSDASDFPKFFNPVTGKSFPLSRYYKSKPEIFSAVDAYKFYFGSKSEHLDNVAEYDDKDYSQLLKSVSDYENRISQVSERGDFDSYSDCFD